MRTELPEGTSLKIKIVNKTDSISEVPSIAWGINHAVWFYYLDNVSNMGITIYNNKLHYQNFEPFNTGVSEVKIFFGSKPGMVKPLSTIMKTSRKREFF